MDIAKAAERLQSLACDSTKRSKMALLRDIFFDVEAAIHAGVSQIVIVDELRALGLDMSHDTFRSTLRRLRAERRTMLNEASAQPTLPAPLTRRTSPAAFVTSGACYDPAALNRFLDTDPDLDDLIRIAPIGRTRARDDRLHTADNVHLDPLPLQVR